MDALFNLTKRILTLISVLILSALAIIIIISIFTRFLGKSLYWYDEISAILLAWLTFYGAALSALNRCHMGFGNFIASLPLTTRKVLFCITEVLIISFFILLTWAGFYVLSILVMKHSPASIYSVICCTICFAYRLCVIHHCRTFIHTESV